MSAFHKPVHTKIAIFCLAMIGMNLLDVFATLRHLEHGADELNPVMGYVLSFSPYAFFGVKYILVALAMIPIIFAPYEMSRVVRPAMTFMYGLLSIYQVALFFILP